MVHVFNSLGLTLALDTDSSALHVLDDLTADIIRRWEEGEAAIVAALAPKYGQEDVQEAIGEVRSLVEAGQLFTREDDAVLAAARTQPVIKAMCLHAAHDCDLRCGYCFASTGDFGTGRRLMPLETGMAALDFLIKNSGNRKNLEVDFFGGEPTMNMDVVKKLVAYGRALELAHGKTIHFTITTNAYGIDQDTIDFINREMENVVLSIDGRREVHDRLRPAAGGGGSYQKSVDNARRVVAGREGKSWYIRGTFTKYNLDFAKDVASLRAEGFDQLSLEPVVASPNRPYAIVEEDVPAICQEYERLAADYLAAEQAGEGFGFFHFNVDLEGGPCVAKRLLGCGAGNEYVAVTPDGDLYPCHQFVGREAFCMGNVLQGTFDRAMQAEFAACNVLAKPDCMACWAKYFCSGGCAANAQEFSGDIHKPYHVGCELERKRLECALAIEAHRRLGR
nr:thioether cross-link-forming SCIFF peptide maturase [bacterium]